MKYVIVIPDGCADEPIDALGGKTPLQVANMPATDALAASGSLALNRNPVHSVLSGPVGVGDLGWPSRARGVDARIPEELSAESLLALEERNGFTLLDFDRRSVRIETLACGPEYRSPDQIQLDRALGLEIA